MLKSQGVVNVSQLSLFHVKKHFYWGILLVLFINIALISAQLSAWLIALIGLAMLWKVTLLQKQLPAGKPIIPNRWPLSLFAIVGCIILAIYARQLGLLLTMVHLLSFSYSLKLLELSKRSDFYQFVFIGFFVLSSALIFEQSLLFASIVMLALVINITLLLYYFSSAQSLNQVFYSALKLTLHSIPLAIVLFVVFPRLSPFWQVPLANSSKTGLSDHVNLGDISQLTQSNELAFRVKFDNKKPLFSALYWRAIVLDEFDGKQWKQSSLVMRQQQMISQGLWHYQSPFINLAHVKEAITYQVIAQPSYQKWLFALATPIVQSDKASSAEPILLPDHTLVNKQPLTQPTSYSLKSFLSFSDTRQLSSFEKTHYLTLPSQSNSRLFNYAQLLRQQYQHDNKALIATVLQRIRNQPYRYTLKPPPLINDELAQFFFDTKAGFCVHYASSFAFIMRAAGIPARLVTGYMGGEYNTNGDYFSVYQYDAHAWVEVWLADQGWLRIDPTAMVSPDRIEKGFSQSLFAEQSLLAGNVFSLQHYRNIAWVNFFRQQLDALDYQWTRWVIGYSKDNQFKLLSSWFGNYQTWHIALVIAISLIAAFAWFWWLNRDVVKSVKKSPAIILVEQLLALFAKQHIKKPDSYTLAQFTQQLGRQYPSIKLPLTMFSDHFAVLCFTKLTPEENVNHLQGMKKALRVIKKRLSTGVVGESMIVHR